MNRLAGSEIEAAPGEADGLRAMAQQMHLDRGFRIVPAGLVLKRLNHEVRAEFSIDPREQIEIELRGHAGGIIVGGDQDVEGLLEIDAGARTTQPRPH